MILQLVAVITVMLAEPTLHKTTRLAYELLSAVYQLGLAAQKRWAQTNMALKHSGRS